MSSNSHHMQATGKPAARKPVDKQDAPQKSQSTDALSDDALKQVTGGPIYMHNDYSVGGGGAG